MKYSEIDFKVSGTVAIVKEITTGKQHTVAETNELGGQCDCCVAFRECEYGENDEYIDNLIVLKVVNVQEMNIIYEAKSNVEVEGEEL